MKAIALLITVVHHDEADRKSDRYSRKKALAELGWEMDKRVRYHIRQFGPEIAAMKLGLELPTIRELAKSMRNAA